MTDAALRDVEAAPGVVSPRGLAGDPTEFPRTLVVTAHLAPRRGGVETFTEQITRRLPADRVTVLAPEAPGDGAVDRQLPFEVVRYPGRLVTHPSLARRVGREARARGIEAAWVTSAMPLGALAVPLRRAGVARIVVSTHGMEVGWASVPAAAALMRRVARSADVITYLGDYTKAGLAPVLRAGVGSAQLTGGVDVEQFSPDVDAGPARRRFGLDGRPVVVSASRLVPRKGHDVLIRAWPRVQARHPGARLLIVGGGHHRRTLARLASSVGVAADVIFSGAASDVELPAYLACGDVFALPCRDVWAGLQVEGLGLSILEASAMGLPVVVGASGGSPDALIDGVTGVLVDGRSEKAVADALGGLLDDRDRARRMGAAGRAWVTEAWGWEHLAGRLRDVLVGAPALRRAS